MYKGLLKRRLDSGVQPPSPTTETESSSSTEQAPANPVGDSLREGRDQQASV